MESDFYKQALKGIRNLAETRDDLSALAAYYESLLNIQEKAVNAFSPDLDAIDIDTALDRCREGQSALVADEIQPDWDAYDKALEAIADVTREHAQNKDGQTWPTLDNRDDAWHTDLLTAVVSGNGNLDRFARDTGASPDLFAFLAFQALVPFVEPYAEALKGKIKLAAWLKGTCPVCGGEPLIGKLEKEAGKRFLQCSLCHTEWPTKRIACPFCDNENQKKLRFFADEKEPAYRVDVCDQCKTYLKIVDERKATGDVVLFADNLATLHMDLVAREEGFSRNTNKLFGF